MPDGTPKKQTRRQASWRPRLKAPHSPDRRRLRRPPRPMPSGCTTGIRIRRLDCFSWPSTELASSQRFRWQTEWTATRWIVSVLRRSSHRFQDPHVFPLAARWLQQRLSALLRQPPVPAHATDSRQRRGRADVYPVAHCRARPWWLRHGRCYGQVAAVSSHYRSRQRCAVGSSQGPGSRSFRRVFGQRGAPRKKPRAPFSAGHQLPDPIRRSLSRSVQPFSEPQPMVGVSIASAK